MLRFALVLAATASVAACASHGSRTLSSGQTVGAPYRVGGVTYTPKADPRYDKVGTATWYGDAYHNRKTASGERFDMNGMTAAHTTLPLPSMVEVTNLDNGRKAVLRVNDRGPFTDKRIIDVSRGAARELGFERQGLARVRVRYVGPADGAAPRLARRAPPPTPPTPTPTPTQGFVEAAVSREPPPVAVAMSVPAYVAPAAPIEVAALEAPRPAAPTPAPSGGWRIQVGAYADPMNARSAADRLAGAGSAVIEPVSREGGTVYRVFLPAPPDEAGAFALRDRAAAFGFTDARVVRSAGL